MKKRTVFVIIVAAAVVAIFAYELIAGRNPVVAPESSAELSAVSSSIAQSAERVPGNEAAWLRFEGTDIDNPVMQAGDNEYYLRRNEEGEEDMWGCYFLDYECGPTSQNLIIYGHSYGDNIDDQRFSQLKRLNDQTFAEEHNIIELEMEGETRRYQVFSSGYASALTDHVILAADPGRDTMQEIVDMALTRSQHDYGVEVSADDQILTLCTCTTDEEMRYVVVAKQV